MIWDRNRKKIDTHKYASQIFIRDNYNKQKLQISSM